MNNAKDTIERLSAEILSLRQQVKDKDAEIADLKSAFEMQRLAHKAIKLLDKALK